jgi:wobble nucleotide-excising tRNase
LEKINNLSSHIGNKESEDWLRKGYKILSDSVDNLHHCPLCNSNIANTIEVLLSDYSNYFSSEYESFQFELVNQIKQNDLLTGGVNERSENYMYVIFEKYKFLTGSFEYKIDDSLISDLLSELKCIKRLLEQKKIDINNPIKYDLSKFERLLDTYNSQQDKLQKIRQVVLSYLLNDVGNKKKVESQIKELFHSLYYLKLVEQNIDVEPIEYLEKLEAEVQSNKSNLQAQEIDYKEQLTKMKFESKYVNEYLKRLNVSKFSVDIDDTLQVIYSENKRIKTSLKHSLSEGEKTTLAFAYFLSKVRVEQSESYNNCIIYIDDPISSLDESRLFYTANVINNEFTSALQLFISSHNLKFLKILINFKFSDTLGLYEIKYDKCSLIKDLPEVLWNFNTSYYYKLNQIIDYVNGVIEHSTAIFFVPNNIRVVLESFLSFKFCYLKSKNNVGNTPGLAEMIGRVKNEKNDYFKNLKPCADINKDNWKDCLDYVITKISDAFSHGSPSNMDISFNPVSEEELKKVSNSVINIMKFMDHVHFDKVEKIGTNVS